MSILNVLTSNFILDVDSYKQSHYKQYPSHIKFLFDAITPRKVFTREGIEIDHVVAFGAQLVAIIIDNVKITQEMIDEAEIEINEQGYEFKRSLWESLIGKKLPLRIKAVKDGTVVPVGNPIMTIENTKPGYHWLVSYIETWVQRLIWKATTTATLCYTIKGILAKGMIETAGHTEGLDYMLHNFGDRGASGLDSAIISGMAHLTQFSGTDCLQANRYVKRFYNTKNPIGSSIDASEHSVMCSNADATKRCDLNSARVMVDQHRQNVERLGYAITACVIDTYDDERFITEYIGQTELKEVIKGLNGRMVFRPDSGDPVEKPVRIIELLMGVFGFTVNDKGNRVLPSYVRVIQGDGVDVDYFPKIIAKMKEHNLSLENLAFGMGAGLTDDAKRDWFSFAMKATAMSSDQENWIDLFKDPITDSSKRSQRGRVTTYRDSNGNIFTERDNLQTFRDDVVDILDVIYDDGIIKQAETTFEQVRSISIAA